MADVKISGLPALTTPAGVDLVPVVDDPGGTPASKATTVEGLLRGGFISAPTIVPLVADDLLFVDDPGGTPTTGRATLGTAINVGLLGLATVTPAPTDECVIIDDPGGIPISRTATVTDVVDKGIAGLATVVPLTTDEVVIVDDPAGTPAGRAATIPNVVERGVVGLTGATPILTDRLVFIDDPSGTPLGRTALISQILALAVPQYGALYDLEGTTSNISVGTGYTLFNTFDDALQGGGVTANHTTDTITVATTGVYDIEGHFSFSGTANITFWIALAVNGTPSTRIIVKRKLGTGGDVGACGFTGIRALTAGDVLTVQVKSDTVGPNTFTSHAAQFTAKLMQPV